MLCEYVILSPPEPQKHNTPLVCCRSLINRENVCFALAFMKSHHAFADKGKHAMGNAIPYKFTYNIYQGVQGLLY